jgi:hypothetical protein
MLVIEDTVTLFTDLDVLDKALTVACCKHTVKKNAIVTDRPHRDSYGKQRFAVKKDGSIVFEYEHQDGMVYTKHGSRYSQQESEDTAVEDLAEEFLERLEFEYNEVYRQKQLAMAERAADFSR